MQWVLVLGALALLVGQSASREAKPEPRFIPYKGDFRFGVHIAPPWADGGYLEVNFPEHLERYPDTQGILRYSDTVPPPWKLSADGKQAVLDAESANLPGIHVKGVGKVISPSRVEFRIEIANHTDKPLQGIIPLYCFRYRGLTGFPQWQQNFAHTYVLMGGKLVPLTEVKTADPKADVKGGYVRGNPQRDSDSFPSSRGGLVAEPFDRGITAITSLDGKKKVLVSWTPAKSILSNAAIPCIHADPYYGPIAPGKAVTRKGVVVFTEEPLEQAVQKLVKEGWGAPVSQ